MNLPKRISMLPSILCFFLLPSIGLWYTFALPKGISAASIPSLDSPGIGRGWKHLGMESHQRGGINSAMNSIQRRSFTLVLFVLYGAFCDFVRRMNRREEEKSARNHFAGPSEAISRVGDEVVRSGDAENLGKKDGSVVSVVEVAGPDSDDSPRR
ncbi:hypothetical protein BJ508DRAFT_349655 [Ascobolus immersus RN42]|uniref:Transmembrane protein n=1 Tax=Ascobolus immersus RN42 TaxID=1160509 RepID=A0A3N4IIT0_ASCIM|nr:hypothetical protein BJ508DRAFT_349655 [Ascobolus immersus RN42]